MGSVVLHVRLGDHVHLQEGAEEVGVVVQDLLLELNSQLAALGSVELGGELLDQGIDLSVLVSAEVVALAGQAAGGEEILRVAGGC